MCTVKALGDKGFARYSANKQARLEREGKVAPATSEATGGDGRRVDSTAARERGTAEENRRSTLLGDAGGVSASTEKKTLLGR